MGFWSKVGESLKETGKNISDEIKRRNAVINTKKRILSRFEMNNLKKICKDYGIEEPLPYEEDILTGQRRRRVVTRDNYAGQIINKLTLDQIKNFSEKNKISIHDIIKEEEKSVLITNTQKTEIKEPEPKVTTIEVKRQGQFDSIIDTIRKDFEPEDIRDEEDFEKQLTQFLKLKYPDQVKRQFETPKGKIDLVINNRYAIELKIADNKAVLRNLVGQAHNYKKVFNDLAIILLDVGKMSRSEIKESIDDYEQFGVKTLVLDGVLKRRKSKSKQINIKLSN